MVEANEPGTLNYKFYIDDSETKCILNDTYANSEVVFAHIAGVASQTILPKIFGVSKISKHDVCGNPSKELQKVLTGFGSQTYSPFAVFSRGS